MEEVEEEEKAACLKDVEAEKASAHKSNQILHKHFQRESSTASACGRHSQTVCYQTETTAMQMASWLINNCNHNHIYSNSRSYMKRNMKNKNKKKKKKKMMMMMTMTMTMKEKKEKKLTTYKISRKMKCELMNTWENNINYFLYLRLMYKSTNSQKRIENGANKMEERWYVKEDSEDEFNQQLFSKDDDKGSGEKDDEEDIEADVDWQSGEGAEEEKWWREASWKRQLRHVFRSRGNIRQE
ncbi:uncharacterized protein MONOS_8056 [Monocercomonoides exilis]|uniref:uncharacterized protein n=1 Tax=Monocercomonoides exilis TaxID=2049356 RepID=UPI00355A10E2|nr:hypothetical protein MONOS_8056 [Monocercomonoides exilis]|eukprot:MONOS_8056.1-p1 / transcript=MONOS_8056.1 / gene=MONOS_8056 / organism=Monocercomonoides_exilis_PA203 / gene_product=unspecified product / transcript_product=unspecified product / location=Mono_scaffold00293:44200-44922(-) / protein_length=241 / sequence_SO=supercontig / SO=protein_coding / is_pseudo=false